MSFLNLKASNNCNCVQPSIEHEQVKEPVAVQNDSRHPVTCPSTATEEASESAFVDEQKPNKQVNGCVEILVGLWWFKCF